MDECIQDVNDIIYHAPNRTTQHKAWWGLLLNDSKEGYIGKNALKKTFRRKTAIYRPCYGWFACLSQKHDKHL